MESERAIEIATAINRDPWAILPAAVHGLSAVVAGGEGWAARTRSRDLQPYQTAVIPLLGTVTLRGQYFGGTAIQGFRSQFRRALADPSIKMIMLDVDSPGGQIAGVPELAEEIYAARGTKPITAVANGLAASAAYWIAAAADELIVTRSGQVGSIGCFAVHQDISRWLKNKGVKMSLISAGEYKTELNRLSRSQKTRKLRHKSEWMNITRCL
jgi:ClpP class serine protease